MLKKPDVIARRLTVVMVVVAVLTVGVALALAVVDRLLLSSAVCFVGLIPVALLTWAVERRTPARDRAARLAAGLRQGRVAFAVGGLGLVVAGVSLVLARASAGSAPDILLMTAPALLFGGMLGRHYARMNAASEAGDGTNQGQGFEDRGSVRARRIRYGIVAWVCGVSVLTPPLIQTGAVSHLLAGVGVLVLACLPLGVLVVRQGRR